MGWIPAGQLDKFAEDFAGMCGKLGQEFYQSNELLSRQAVLSKPRPRLTVELAEGWGGWTGIQFVLFQSLLVIPRYYLPSDG